VKISTVLDQVEYKQIALPEFQRGYVWGPDQVRGLFHSLYQRYPVGSLLLWTTELTKELVRGDGGPAAGSVIKLLLDGQQRITSLYGVMKGRPPEFFQGNEKAFQGLYFNLETETFQFYGPIKMKGDPRWISVTRVYKTDANDLTKELMGSIGDINVVLTYSQRINKLLAICDIELHPEEITGAERTIDEVVEIFNRVNSGGTKLSAGDLALARICADRPTARAELRRMLTTWEKAGYRFSMEWLLRCVNSIVTGQAKFTALRTTSSDEFETGLKKVEQSINFLLNLVADRLGLDHDRVLAGRYAFTALVRLVADQGGLVTDHIEQQKILYWYVQCFMWGRYSGSTESVLQRDLDAMASSGIDGAITELRRWRGSLEVRPEDFDSHSVGSRFYPMLYMLTRVGGAQDLKSGLGLNASMLGANSTLHLHHIFPKARLYDAGYQGPQVNAVANMCFLTATSNLSISANDPAVYLKDLNDKHPDVLASQWISTDPQLWTEARYLDFLADRRHKLATAANEFLTSLLTGTRDFDREVGTAASEVAEVGVDSAEERETSALDDIVALAAERGLATPYRSHEITDAESGEVLAIADLAWPDGAQEGLTQPVALLLEPDEEMEARLGELGYRFFTSKEKLVWYLESLLGVDIDGDELVGEPGPDESVSGSTLASGTTCREEVLRAFERLGRRHGTDEFDLVDIIAEVQAAGAGYKDATIRAHVVSHMCADAPGRDPSKPAELERTARGRYRRR
jgi:hypothetical protein